MSKSSKDKDSPPATPKESKKGTAGKGKGEAATPKPTVTVVSNVLEHKELYPDTWFAEADFIYGGPFLVLRKPDEFIDTKQPVCAQLQGTFKKGHAYESLKDRLPIIITKTIDKLSKSSPSAQDVIGRISKLKSDLMTNKKYDQLELDTEEAKKWNKAIENCDNKHYYNNLWVFTECYVYRKIWESCQRSNIEADFFAEEKKKLFDDSLETICQVAEKFTEMLPVGDKDKRKQDFNTLLKLSLWANKCDLAHSLCEPLSMKSAKNNMKPFEWPKKKKPKKVKAPLPGVEPVAAVLENKPSVIMDPLQMILDLKDRVLADDANKAADQIPNKAEKITNAIANYTPPPRPVKGKKVKKPPPPPPPPVELGPDGQPLPEPPKIPCPAKINIPSAVFFDIVCDNAGYELFCDMCIAHFLIAQQIVQKIRFHVKKFPWFVSNATPKDISALIEACKSANFTKSAPAPETKEGEPPGVPINISADKLGQLGTEWAKFLENGTFIVMADDFWVSPYLYKDMKRLDYNLYRKLQMACGILFKGDLNYRKLMGEKKWNPYTKFEECLQGFIPAPIIAVRTVKSDMICAMKKGQYELINEVNPKWFEIGDFGVIHFCGKAEKIVVSDRPCLDYANECKGVTCPVHTDL